MKRIYKKAKKFKNSVIIYQMGKVGSSTIMNSLNNLSIDNIQIHSFENYTDPMYPCKNKKRNWKQYNINFSPLKLNKQIRSFFTIKIYRQLLDYYRKKGSKKIKIITLVREPVGREISRFFQNIEAITYYNRYILKGEKGKNLQEMYLKYNNKYSTVNYFDEEFFKFTGIDVYNYPFDKEKGFSLIEKDNISLLILKLEKLNDLTPILKSFIGNEKFELEKSNETSNKWHYILYKDFIKNYYPEKEHLDYIYSSKYIKHFYTGDEVEKFRKKWLEKE